MKLLRLETPAGLEENLNAAIARLQERAKEIRQATSHRFLNPKRPLMLFVGYIEEKTGTPHYRDVSLLLEVAYSVFGAESEGSIGEEAIRKAVERFKRHNPSLVDANGKFRVSGLLAGLGFAAILLMVVHELVHRPK